MSAFAAVASVGIVTAVGIAGGWEGLLRAGIIQPLLAFTLSGCFICAVRGWGGRLFDGARRGETRPSPALVLGRLWMQCFAAVMLAILLSTIAQRISFVGVDDPGVKPAGDPPPPRNAPCQAARSGSSRTTLETPNGAVRPVVGQPVPAAGTPPPC